MLLSFVMALGVSEDLLQHTGGSMSIRPQKYSRLDHPLPFSRIPKIVLAFKLLHSLEYGSEKATLLAHSGLLQLITSFDTNPLQTARSSLRMSRD